MARRATRHPVTTRLPIESNRQMAAWWGEQAIAAIRAAVATPRPATIDDLDLHHAVRAARFAWWHATKVTNRKER